MFTQNKNWKLSLLLILAFPFISGCFLLANTSSVPPASNELKDWRLYGAFGATIAYFLQLGILFYIANTTPKNEFDDSTQKNWQNFSNHFLQPLFSLLMFTIIGQWSYVIARLIFNLGTIGKGLTFILAVINGLNPGLYIGQYVLFGWVFNDFELLKFTFAPTLVTSTIVYALLGYIQIRTIAMRTQVPPPPPPM
jgi:hypothetical protein